MILKSDQLKKLYTKYLLNKKDFPRDQCPSIDEIIKSLRSPSKKTRKTMDHIIDCPPCYSMFLFLQEIIKEEANMIKAIESRFSGKKLRPSLLKEYFNHRLLLKSLPYALITIAFAFFIFVVYQFIFVPHSSFMRSGHPSLVFSLSPVNEKQSTSEFTLQWSPVPYAQSYSLYVFDSELRSVWKGIVRENRCQLPSHVSKAINEGMYLTLSLEAIAEDGRVIQAWFADMPKVNERSRGKATLTNRHKE